MPIIETIGEVAKATGVIAGQVAQRDREKNAAPVVAGAEKVAEAKVVEKMRKDTADENVAQTQNELAESLVSPVAGRPA